MFMSALWDTIFDIIDRYEDAEVFLIDRHIPALRFGRADKPTVFAAGFQEQEWECSVLLLRFFEQLLSDAAFSRNMAGISVRKAFKRHSLIVIPTACPSCMGAQTQKAALKDLKAVTRFLEFHKAQMLFTIDKQQRGLFSPAANGRLPSDIKTIKQVICACSKLQELSQAQSAAGKLCEWSSTNSALPSFSLSLGPLKASSLPYTYQELEEAFIVSALL